MTSTQSILETIMDFISALKRINAAVYAIETQAEFRSDLPLRLRRPVHTIFSRLDIYSLSLHMRRHPRRGGRYGLY